MNCCNDMTGLCADGPGCAAHLAPAPASCPPCTHDCNEGKTCATRLRNAEIRNAQIILQIQRDVTAQLAAAERQHCNPAVLRNIARREMDRTSAHQPTATEAHDQWLNDLFYRAIFWALVIASAAVAIGCLGYLYRVYARWAGV